MTQHLGDKILHSGFTFLAGLDGSDSDHVENDSAPEVLSEPVSLEAAPSPDAEARKSLIKVLPFQSRVVLVTIIC